MRPLLKDPALQAEVEDAGFTVVRLFTPEQVRLLLVLYARTIRPDAVSGLYESSRHNSYEVNRQINHAILEQVRITGEKLFMTCRIYGGSFMVKSRSGSEVLPLHQDWSVVEEEKYRTLFIWCPLVDVSPSNGCLYTLPASHRYFQSLRSGSYPSDRFVLPAELHQHLCDIPLKAGEAILYSDQLFHGSHANNGGRDRIVVTARIMEQEAELVYFHKANDREVDVYWADEEFYLTHIDTLAKGRLPTGAKRLYRRPYTHVPVTDQDLQAKVRQHFPSGPFLMKPIFKDAVVQAQFEKDGCVVIDLLNHSQIDELISFYNDLTNDAAPAGGFQVSLDNRSPAFVRAVSEKLIGTVSESVDRHFQDHRIFTASFVTKEKNPQGVVPPHQDWTFVDESRFWSATVWCALRDVNMDNGALGAIKGSHRFYDHVRPSPSPQYTPPFKDQLYSIFPYLTIFEIKAGQAVVFDNRILHASPPNTTEPTRLAFGIGVTHKDAGIRHYYLLPGSGPQRIEGFHVESDFFYEYNNARLSAVHQQGLKPEGLDSFGVFAMTAKQYTTEQLVEAIQSAGNRRNDVLVEKMTALFVGNGGAARTDIGGKQEPAGKLPFWKVYTPLNIAREIRYRIGVAWRSVRTG
jgi:ectoine hydroxylase-related dioxygenase (phytanoyl-CoA dioxygenase family)